MVFKYIGKSFLQLFYLIKFFMYFTTYRYFLSPQFLNCVINFQISLTIPIRNIANNEHMIISYDILLS